MKDDTTTPKLYNDAKQEAGGGWMRRLVHCCFYDGGFWVRIAGSGISGSDKIKHPPLFSERNGYRKVYRIGRWGVEIILANVKLSHDWGVSGQA